VDIDLKMAGAEAEHEQNDDRSNTEDIAWSLSRSAEQDAAEVEPDETRGVQNLEAETVEGALKEGRTALRPLQYHGHRIVTSLPLGNEGLHLDVETATAAVVVAAEVAANVADAHAQGQGSVIH
jgi:hypothetical protein